MILSDVQSHDVSVPGAGVQVELSLVCTDPSCANGAAKDVAIKALMMNDVNILRDVSKATMLWCGVIYSGSLYGRGEG
jgi:hypothetical protein